MVWKYRFGKERYIKQINDIREWQKKWWKKVMSEKNQGLRHRRKKLEVGTLFLSSDKINVIADKVLSYF